MALSRVGIWVVVAVVALLTFRAFSSPQSLPDSCYRADYGRDSYVDCDR